MTRWDDSLRLLQYVCSPLEHWIGALASSWKHRPYGGEFPLDFLSVRKTKLMVKHGVEWLRHTFLSVFRRLDLFSIWNYFRAIFVWGRTGEKILKRKCSNSGNETLRWRQENVLCVIQPCPACYISTWSLQSHFVQQPGNRWWSYGNQAFEFKNLDLRLKKVSEKYYHGLSYSTIINTAQ